MPFPLGVSPSPSSVAGGGGLRPPGRFGGLPSISGAARRPRERASEALGAVLAPGALPGVAVSCAGAADVV